MIAKPATMKTGAAMLQPSAERSRRNSSERAHVIATSRPIRMAFMRAALPRRPRSGHPGSIFQNAATSRSQFLAGQLEEQILQCAWPDLELRERHAGAQQ